MTETYDYIITGAGCAGLSLLMRMQQDDFFSTKQILVIDVSTKTANDRTWCFWEKEPDIFQPIVCKEWASIEFLSPQLSKSFSILPYKYKMIKGIDFYSYCKKVLHEQENISWLEDTVVSLASNKDGSASVHTKSGTFHARFVFNSVVFAPPTRQKGHYYFLQHFTGWEIETPTPVFDSGTARFMDFSIDQSRGTAFMYVLPESPTRALVEYTLFTKSVLEQRQYEEALKQYIVESLGIPAYEVVHKEFGIIPMTNSRFPQQEGSIVHIGIAGNQAKASSGYAFKFIQKRATAIITALKHGSSSFRSWSFHDRKAALYDATLLRVLNENKLQGAAIFSALFKHNPPQVIFSFLDNESSLLTDLKIMNSVPTKIFLPAALKQMVSAV